MNILLCPDKFKGSLSADEICIALRNGLLASDSNYNIVIHPMADGGDGSIDIIKNYIALKSITVQTTDPLGRNIESEYYCSHDTAFIELASASGLVLLSQEERNPMNTSTRGTGLMIKDALERGLSKIYLFIGGSATNDGGIGIAQALGFDFLDRNGRTLDPIGMNLHEIHSIRDNKYFDFNTVEIRVLCDVENLMHGPNGAAYIYAAQKGANKIEIQQLDVGLKNYDEVLQSQFQKVTSNIPGVGAAGAVGASLVGLLHAKLKDGFQMLADLTQLEEEIKKAELVITGEGKIDQTSFQGKVVGNVLSFCQKHTTHCGVVAGMIESAIENKPYFKFEKSVISKAIDFNDAIESTEKYLVVIGKEIDVLLRRH